MTSERSDYPDGRAKTVDGVKLNSRPHRMRVKNAVSSLDYQDYPTADARSQLSDKNDAVRSGIAKKKKELDGKVCCPVCGHIGWRPNFHEIAKHIEAQHMVEVENFEPEMKEKTAAEYLKLMLVFQKKVRYLV